jgi:hypothetical protein
MTSYEFMLKLNREITDEEADALYEVGCGDAGIETGPLGTVADFSREAPSLTEAIVSAVRDIEKILGLRAVGAQYAAHYLSASRKTEAPGYEPGASAV